MIQDPFWFVFWRIDTGEVCKDTVHSITHMALALVVGHDTGFPRRLVKERKQCICGDCQHILNSFVFRDHRSHLRRNAMSHRCLSEASSGVTCVEGLDSVFGGERGVLLGAKKKKAVLLDQFGVLHDGNEAYPGAIEAVDRLHRDHGLRLLIVSNSSRRSEGALENLRKKGFTIESFEGVITSGEVTFRALRERGIDSMSGLSMDGEQGEFWKSRKHCVHFTWGERGAISLEGLDVDVVGRDIEGADSILAHGTEALGMRVDGTGAEACSIDGMKQIMDACAKQGGLPMIVANPDLVTVHGNELRVMPGTLAAHYESLGGLVHRMGKPAKIIYEEALRMLQLAPDDVIAIGDSLEHDIKGAESMGIDSIFIGGGIHKDMVMKGSSIDREGLEALCREHECRPTFALPYFVS